MPPVIGAAILGAVAPGLLGTSVLGIGTATLVGGVALSGALIGVQALLNATAAGIKNTVNIKQALAPRVRIYGRTMVSGAKAFENVRNGNLYQAIMLASDQIDGFELFYIGGEGVAVINNLVLSAPWGRSGGASYIGFDLHLGSSTQPAQGLIQNAYPELGNFQLAGIAYVGVVMLGAKAADFQKIYPQAQDTLFRFVVRGAQVYDPRSGETLWSQNAALCIRDFLTHSDGMALPAALIDDASFSSFAYVCDQAVPLKAGGQEARYTINGTYDLSEEPKTVLARMCAACDGQLVMTPAGKVGITGGVFVSPTVTLTSDHILEAGFEQGAGAFDAYNRLTTSFSYGLNYYQMTENTPINDTASQAVVGDIPETLSLPMVTSYTQAARLAKIKMAKDNPAWRGTLTADAAILDAVGDLTINLDYSPVPYTAPLISTSMQVTSLSLSADLATIDLAVSSLTPDAYAWNPATDEPDAPRSPFEIANYNNVDPPANVHAVITKDTQSNGTKADIGHLTWDAATVPGATPLAQYQISGSGNWFPMTVDATGLAATTPALTPGTSYDFEVAFSAGDGMSADSVVAAVAAP